MTFPALRLQVCLSSDVFFILERHCARTGRPRAQVRQGPERQSRGAEVHRVRPATGPTVHHRRLPRAGGFRVEDGTALHQLFISSQSQAYIMFFQNLLYPTHAGLSTLALQNGYSFIYVFMDRQYVKFLAINNPKSSQIK